MADVDYEWFLDANLEGYGEEKRVVAQVFTELKNLTIRNIDLPIPTLISGEVNVRTPLVLWGFQRYERRVSR